MTSTERIALLTSRRSEKICLVPKVVSFNSANSSLALWIVICRKACFRLKCKSVATCCMYPTAYRSALFLAPPEAAGKTCGNADPPGAQKRGVHRDLCQSKSCPCKVTAMSDAYHPSKVNCLLITGAAPICRVNKEPQKKFHRPRYSMVPKQCRWLTNEVDSRGGDPPLPGGANQRRAAHEAHWTSLPCASLLATAAVSDACQHRLLRAVFGLLTSHMTSDLPEGSGTGVLHTHQTQLCQSRVTINTTLHCFLMLSSSTSS